MPALRLYAFIPLLLFFSCQDKKIWQDADTLRFTKACQEASAAAGDMSAAEYCLCMAGKYKTAGIPVDTLISQMANPAKFMDLGGECRVARNEQLAYWDEKQKASFLKSCVLLARQNRLPDTALCPCVLDKVLRRYRTLEQLEKVNEQQLVHLSVECANERVNSVDN